MAYLKLLLTVNYLRKSMHLMENNCTVSIMENNECLTKNTAGIRQERFALQFNILLVRF